MHPSAVLVPHARLGSRNDQDVPPAGPVPAHPGDLLADKALHAAAGGRIELGEIADLQNVARFWRRMVPPESRVRAEDNFAGRPLAPAHRLNAQAVDLPIDAIRR